MRPRAAWLLALLALGLALGACGRSEAPRERARARLARAEAALAACKDRYGFAATPTPETVVLDDPATRGQPLTPERANQLRMKVQCRLELDELLAARREVAAAR
jgi:hypothetical protein